jgi:hypothetical protein
LLRLLACVVAGSSTLLGCSAPDTSPLGRSVEAVNTRPAGCNAAGVCQVDVSLSNGSRLSQFAAVARDALRLANRAEAKDSSGARSSVLSSSSGGIFIGGYAKLASALSYTGIQIEGGASLSGQAYAKGQVQAQAGAIIAGGVKQNQPFFTHEVNVVPSFVMPSNFAAGVNLEPDTLRSISPGAFVSLTVKSRASLSLAAGSYFVGSLDLEPSGKLRLANSTAPIEIHVLDQLNCKGDWLSELAAPNVRLIYWGTNSTVIECSLPLISVVAPNAQVRIADRKTVGQVLAKGVELGADAVARAVPFRSFVTGPSSKLLRDLTATERLASCRALETFRGPQNRDIDCRLEANGQVVATQPATNAAARATCAATYNACKAADPCAAPEQVPATCEATVDDRDTCLAGLLPGHYAANAAVPVCSSTTIYDAYTYQAQSVDIPGACAAYFRCLGLN